MSTRQRLAGFAVVLGLVFGAGWGLGQLVGPLGSDDPQPADAGSPPTTTEGVHRGGHS